MMKIGFDVSQTAGEKAGCGFVADQLIKSLLTIDRTNEYILYPTFYSYRDPLFHRATRPGAPNCKLHFENMSFKDMRQGWETSMKDRTAWLGSPDIIHSNTFSCIKDHRARVVFTLYDLTPLVCPGVLTEANRINCFQGLFNASIYADHCIAISRHTRKDFLDFFPHYPEDRITVIPLGTRPEIKRIEKPDRQRKVLDKFNIRQEFWLGVGTVEPRKNFQLLIDAYSQLKDDRLLVIAGGKGWLDSGIENKVKKCGLENRVKFLGYVSDPDLSVLYSACFTFVFPSIYEGFGLPVLEAMSCGAPVITSRSGSLPEVGGDAAVYIDPHSKTDLVRQMKFLANHPEKREEYRIKSIPQAKKFSWDKTAKIVLDVYEKTLENHSYFQ